MEGHGWLGNVLFVAFSIDLRKLIVKTTRGEASMLDVL
jgi:hypothetical protein